MITQSFEGDSTVGLGSSLSLKEVVSKNTGDAGSLCFVVRRPGRWFSVSSCKSKSKLTAQSGRPIDSDQALYMVENSGSITVLTAFLVE